MAVLLWPCMANAEIRWSWEDDFSTAERARLTAWITTVVASVEEAIAPYPFDLYIRFYRANSARTPVPWANTIRSSRRQGVNIHVDPGFTSTELLADWTAYHELAHLFLPFLGRSNSWFAEGFASFMQYPLMHAAGVMTTDAMWATYRAKIERAKRNYDMPERLFIDAVPTLRERRDFPTQYWGSAIYFLRVDTELRESNSSVLQVVGGFVACCRFEPRNLDQLIETLDRVAGNDVFSRRLAEFREVRGFPEYAGVLESGK